VTATTTADAEPVPFWLASGAPAPAPGLVGATTADLLIVGGGFTGLWAAIQAKEADPARDVVLVEGDRVGWGATGRNGGFLDASLTHGEANGRDRFGDEYPLLHRLGRENLSGLIATIERHGIDCGLEQTGMIAVARAPHELAGLAEAAEANAALGEDVVLLDHAAMQEQVRSPTYIGGLWTRTGCALVDPARLAWGLLRVAHELGVRVHEHTPVFDLADDVTTVTARTTHGTIRARRLLLATNAYPPLLPTIRRRVVPVYDYVLVTEPLSAAQREAIGWSGRQGLADCANQFHYYRKTDDDRILWGGYDAIYHRGNGFGPAFEQRPETFELLADQLIETFPQLAGIRFTHRWGGAIDTCSRFCVYLDTTHGGKTAFAVGYTGLGVGASRWGAQVALDLLDGRATEATATRFVRSRPLPFPPEPLRYAAIELTRRELARADRNDGRRGLWLRALDRFGLGFDS
jgi:glycine/D-amino acid oxidase-like deaminating enzyme